MRGSPCVYAHRGASRDRAENTLEAFALALEVGANALETDCRVTADGVVALVHDETLLRVAGRQERVDALPWAELSRVDVGALRGDASAFPARLDEALEAFPGAVFNVDVKPTDEAAARAVLRVIERAGAHERVRLASFSGKQMRRLRELGYPGETSLAPDEVVRALTLPASVARPRGATAAQLPTRYRRVDLTSRRVLDRLHGLGLRVDYWVIDDAPWAAALVLRGADGIVTNDPARISRAVSRALN